ncbi:hypothetical protein I4U23_027546 [Adineta vaga]|nr:hypothetical protein I4U23_027546 [Adineta vaga]
MSALLNSNSPPFFHGQPVDPTNNMTYWIGWIQDAEETLFIGERFQLSIKIPTDYLFKAPKVKS